MILNGNTNSHPFHQPDRKAKAIAPHNPSTVGTQHCAGPLEAKCNWMRQRQVLIALGKFQRRKADAASN